jgi:uncharacterized protein
MEWLLQNIIYITLHGSNAYGLNTDQSDLDMKGIFIPPKRIENHLFNKIDQVENNPKIDEKYSHLKNPNNPKLESTIFSLKKFLILASQINPNIIELLWVDKKDQLFCHPIMEKLIENRNLFLSSKAKFTYSGYSFAQLSRIERHRKWIVLGDLKEPKREDFGLPIIRARQLDEVFGFVKSEVERWNLSKFSLDEMERNDLKETIWDLILNVSNLPVGWDNWPETYEVAVINKLAKEYDLKEEIVELLNRERRFKREMEIYKSWLNWKTNRNKERAKLEEKCGYDSKHAMHLVRLLKTGYEILTESKVIVKRPDREELLLIKNGGWSYEKIIEYSKEMQLKMDEVYKTTKLPKSVDYEKINDLYYNLVEIYHNSANSRQTKLWLNLIKKEK